MAQLRAECPWDIQQTHQSLLSHLVEETGEVIDAVEVGTDEDLCEELGDLLLQIYFHAQIAEEEGRFTVEDVARGIGDKLVRRHPHVFAAAAAPTDLHASWEQQKRQEKQRNSALDGIAQALNPVARTHKVISRARSHQVAVELPQDPITADELGEQMLALVARAQASGIDTDAAIRQRLRDLEAAIRVAEQDD